MRQLGRLEEAVMASLWAVDGPVSVRQVVESLRQDRTLAYTTVMTVLDNLHRKRLVERTKDGRAYRYRPRLSREEHAAALMEEVLSTSLDREATLLRFVEQMPAEEVERLRAALNTAAVEDEVR